MPIQFQMFPVAAVVLFLIWLVGVIFSVFMLIDCLKRNPTEFKTVFTESREFDKVIWASFIVVSPLFFFIGSIAYFIGEKRGTAKTQG